MFLEGLGDLGGFESCVFGCVAPKLLDNTSGRVRKCSTDIFLVRAYAAFGVVVHGGLVWWRRGDSGALVVAELLDVAARELSGSVGLEAERRAAGGI